MSQKRQTAVFDPTGETAAHLTTLSYDYPDHYVVPLHFHDRDQLIYASRGVMTVTTAHDLWVIPSLRAVWVPAHVSHTITMSGAVSMRTLYMTPGIAVDMPSKCCAVAVSPLLRELILHACTHKSLAQRNPRDRTLINMLVDQVTDAHALPLNLPTPTDTRVRPMVDAYLRDPSDPSTLAAACRACAAGKRTVERIFVRETGMTFGRWRQQLRLVHALKLLAAGEKIAHVALEAGYTSPSAFTSMFRRSLGCAPSQYFGHLDL